MIPKEIRDVHMNSPIKKIIRNILVAVMVLSAVSACTIPERETSSSYVQSERVLPQKSEEEIYEEKRNEAVGATIDIYNEILNDD